jgi:hypothetical protein
VNQTVRLPRWRKAASYSAQLKPFASAGKYDDGERR